MSEVVTDKFNRQPRKPLHVPFSIISGELTAERFKRCNLFLSSEGAHQFYRAGRLTPEGEMQVGVFKKALQHLRITKEESLIYEPWQALSRAEILVQAQTKYAVCTERVVVLRELGDIAVHIKDTLEALQESLYPDIANDLNSKDTAERSMSTILASIHGNPRK